MEVTLVDQDKHDKLNKDDEIINTYSSTYTGSSGTGVYRQELTLKDITNLGDFTEEKEPGEED